VASICGQGAKNACFASFGMRTRRIAISTAKEEQGSILDEVAEALEIEWTKELLQR
jgi:hypothetical protein